MIFFKRLRNSLSILLIFTLSAPLLQPLPAAAAGERCTVEMNNKAVSSLREASQHWRSLFAHQKEYAPCDDGELGEGYSDAVVRLFSRQWNQFDTFVAISLKDPAFQQWTIRHIDATASDADLKAVAHNAAICKNGKGAKGKLCEAIRQSAEKALAETRS